MKKMKRKNAMERGLIYLSTALLLLTAMLLDVPTIAYANENIESLISEELPAEGLSEEIDSLSVDLEMP
ncbi:MAG: hypothetical protein IIZ39_09545, partial [Blautia sp.]|nr:hypothetical protein [Blautia sp.]